MNRLASPPALCVTLCAVLAVPATAQTRVRHDVASFDLPAGWTKAEADGALVLEPAAKNAVVTLARSTPLDGGIDRYGEGLVAEARKAPDFRIEVQPESGRHPRSTGRWHRFVYSEADPRQAGTYLYTTALSVGAGGRAVTFRMVTAGTGPYEQHRETLGAMVGGVELTTAQRLERGSPPLTRYLVDETTAFLEWLVHVPLTEDQKATVEAELRRSWRAKDQDEITGIQEMLQARAELAKVKEAERELARQAVLEEALAQWRKDQDSEGARMMLAIHQAANQPIAQGEPPLTAQAVEAFAEFLTFAAGKAAGVEAKLPEDTREKLVAGIAEGYADLPKPQRELVASMPKVWAALRVLWPDLPPQEQQGYVQGWQQDGSIAALGKVLKDLAAVESGKNLAKLQAQMQAQRMYFQTMQNVMQMRHDTMRIIIGNIGGNTRYEYRYRW